MNWRDAFTSGNGNVTSEVARFMTLEFNWEVVTWNGRLSSIITPDGSMWKWGSVGVPNSLHQIEEMRVGIGLSEAQLSALDKMFSKTSVGKYTVLPFPKDKRSQPPAPAPHLQ